MAGQSTPGSPASSSSQLSNQPTALQQHVLFWDQDNDGIIWPLDVYRGFRALGFSIIFSFGGLLIPLLFSYRTRLVRSYIPDPFFRLYVSGIHNAKHTSDTGIFDVKGHFVSARFDAMFDQFDHTNSGGLSARELWALLKYHRSAWDPAGSSFAFMEMWTTSLLIQRDGRVSKEDLKGCYDGSLFWKIADLETARRNGAKIKGRSQLWEKGYGIADFVQGLWQGRTWKNWELKKDL
ncbi:hypothetical protein B0A52_05321 [Exophiala mesophila]|uniref:EF-hand domain-containing protein n=1 Tax=Exophiala mesophila TaxID=212818 RepID=A0A438N4X1_EXOME|nr:hypothetical protein B0A52_05321 [Exophiala mesophila]